MTPGYRPRQIPIDESNNNPDMINMVNWASSCYFISGIIILFLITKFDDFYLLILIEELIPGTASVSCAMGIPILMTATMLSGYCIRAAIQIIEAKNLTENRNVGIAAAIWLGFYLVTVLKDIFQGLSVPWYYLLIIAGFFCQVLGFMAIGRLHQHYQGVVSGLKHGLI